MKAVGGHLAASLLSLSYEPCKFRSRPLWLLLRSHRRQLRGPCPRARRPCLLRFFRRFDVYLGARLMYQVRIFRGAERGWQNCSPRGYKAACELQARVKRILPLNPVRLVCLSPELPCFN